MDDVISLIGNTLATLDPNVTIYRDDQTNGAFETPCYFIQQLPTVVSPSNVGDHDKLMCSFDVAYFPDEENEEKRSEISAKSAFLLSKFKKIEPNYAWLWNRNLAVVQNVMHLTFDVRIELQPVDDTPTLIGLDYTGGIKNG